MFLDKTDLEILTGAKRTSCQIDALKIMGIPFYLNPAGNIVVTKMAVEQGGASKNSVHQQKEWAPKVLSRGV